MKTKDEKTDEKAEIKLNLLKIQSERISVKIELAKVRSEIEYGKLARILLPRDIYVQNFITEATLEERLKELNASYDLCHNLLLKLETDHFHRLFYRVCEKYLEEEVFRDLCEKSKILLRIT